LEIREFKHNGFVIKLNLLNQSKISEYKTIKPAMKESIFIPVIVINEEVAKVLYNKLLTLHVYQTLTVLLTSQPVLTPRCVNTFHIVFGGVILYYDSRNVALDPYTLHAIYKDSYLKRQGFWKANFN